MACTGHLHTSNRTLQSVEFGVENLQRVECKDLDPIQKYAIHQGNGTKLEWIKGSKAMIHYKSAINDQFNHECTHQHLNTGLKLQIADSNVDVDPFELRIGLGFAVETMENCVKQMTVGEVSKFIIPPNTFKNYEALERTLRDMRDQERSGRHSGCSHGLNNTNAHTDLKDIHEHTIELTLHLIEMHSPNEYIKELWEMSHEEKFIEAPICKDEGNLLYNQKRSYEASEKYKRSIILLESIILSAYMIDAERESINCLFINAQFTEYAGKIVQPRAVYALLQICRLNFAACKLQLGEFTDVIVQCTEVIIKDPVNVKALYRRAQAYGKMGRDFELAFKDIQTIRQIVQGTNDVSLEVELHKEELMLDQKQKAFNISEKIMFTKMFA